MRKFKIGDKVIHNGKIDKFTKGKEGYIVGYTEHGIYCYDVSFFDFDEGHNGDTGDIKDKNRWYCIEEDLSFVIENELKVGDTVELINNLKVYQFFEDFFKLAHKEKFLKFFKSGDVVPNHTIGEIEFIADGGTIDGICIISIKPNYRQVFLAHKKGLKLIKEN